MGNLGANLKKYNWANEKVVEFEKNFYYEHPNVDEN